MLRKSKLGKKKSNWLSFWKLNIAAVFKYHGMHSNSNNISAEEKPEKWLIVKKEWLKLNTKVQKMKNTNMGKEQNICLKTFFITNCISICMMSCCYVILTFSW